MHSEPLQEHLWLQRFVGEWTVETEMLMGPDKPPERTTGSELVRSLGGFWVVCEGEGEMPGGGRAGLMMTLGYDPEQGRYVGTWVGSMMSTLWTYEGELDSEARVLTLNTQGPDCQEHGQSRTYKDVIAFENDDHRVLTSHLLGDDGVWHQLMRADYHRTK